MSSREFVADIPAQIAVLYSTIHLILQLWKESVIVAVLDNLSAERTIMQIQ